jgi:hypothetical protein
MLGPSNLKIYAVILALGSVSEAVTNKCPDLFSSPGYAKAMTTMMTGIHPQGKMSVAQSTVSASTQIDKIKQESKHHTTEQQADALALKQVNKLKNESKDLSAANRVIYEIKKFVSVQDPVLDVRASFLNDISPDLFEKDFQPNRAPSWQRLEQTPTLITKFESVLDLWQTHEALLRSEEQPGSDQIEAVKLKVLNILREKVSKLNVEQKTKLEEQLIARLISNKFYFIKLGNLLPIVQKLNIVSENLAFELMEIRKEILILTPQFPRKMDHEYKDITFLDERGADIREILQSTISSVLSGIENKSPALLEYLEKN